ncbi:hypothetical protein [Pseudorhodoferax sp. Leaf267]|uniref:hypothetical protein n=1 Tax=Pseudorhodoferax sp. Leaf267 TaxID=1736316 RepID=UPI0006FBAF6F|nr:hypothetical protein [Pseudorhodoferax sp. Leaf267]
MTRWLLLFIGFMLPVQLAWSAAAVYCQHETAPASFHVGHHAHAHGAAEPVHLQSGASSPAADSAPAQLHGDCGYCHLNVAQLPFASGSILLPAQSSALGAPAQHLYGDRIDPDIERPKWTRAS